ncbi:MULTISPECIES: AraC family transcriptional regulator [Paenibacillus]|uniref:AraC family transcriptional regulator n=1 Tax=Paenibacillus TaxID=44249 RepID=UPI002FE2F228
MDALQSMNEAMRYIEGRLTGEIDYQEAARLAQCSEYHFKRMFSFLAGIPLSEYIRRRRLTLAGLELGSSNAKIIDVAMKYGYASPDSFARAFHAMHGILPSEAKARGSLLKAYPRMTFQLTVQGGDEMKYRLVEKEAFRIVGLKKRVNLIFHGVNPEIAEMAASLDEETIKLLKRLSNTNPQGIISASAHFSDGRMEEQGELDHYIGAATTLEGPEHLASLEVPASTWAVFEAVGTFPDVLQSVWGRIYSEWFPSTDYEAVEGPEILWNEHPDTTDPDYRSEIWIPVRRKPEH